MNAAAVRPLRMAQQTYAIHRCYDDGRAPVWTAAADTLQGCIENAMGLASRGDKFAVIERDAQSGDAWIHTYQVKQSGMRAVAVGVETLNRPRLVAEPLTTMRLVGGELPR